VFAEPAVGATANVTFSEESFTVSIFLTVMPG